MQRNKGWLCDCKIRGTQALIYTDNFPHRHAMRVANTYLHAHSPLNMSQHHYHAVLIPVRMSHLKSNQGGCDSSLAAAPLLSWLVLAVNTLSLVFSRPQMATVNWNLPLKHPLIRTSIPGLSVCICYAALFTSRLKYVPLLQWINSA